MSRTRVLVAVAFAAALAAIAMRGCRQPADESPVPPPADAAASEDAALAAARRRSQADAEAATRARHDAAMREAVSTLHRYLAKLPEDRAAADAFWIDGAPAPDADEADLRHPAATPTYFRTRNRTPEVLAGRPVPEAVRIPVELRMAAGEGPPRRYSGWYELEYVSAQDAWRISGAAVDPVPAAQ